MESNLSKGVGFKACRDVDIGGIYLAIFKSAQPPIEYTIYRVRVELKDESKKKAFCFYIDDGYHEWLQYDAEKSSDQSLFEMDARLLKYPAIAVNLTLFNLDQLAENNDAKQEVRLLWEKSFIARVRSTKAEYEAQRQSVGSDPKVNVVLWTVNDQDEDINVNKLILETVCNKMKTPTFEPNVRNEVNVKYISDDGKIYCQLQGSKDMKIIVQMIDKLTANGINETYRIDPNDLSISQNLRLIHDVRTKRWYRAIILSHQVTQSTCLCVDFGFTKTIAHEHIYNLDRLSLALSKYPHQAMAARLHGIQAIEYTSHLIERMRELLPCDDTIVFVEVKTPLEVPLVFAWKRTSSNVLCKINDKIRTEIDK